MRSDTIKKGFERAPHRSLLHALGADRVCFGSDAPFRSPYVIRAMYEASMEDQLSKEEQAMVMGGNIARIFGL